MITQMCPKAGDKARRQSEDTKTATSPQQMQRGVVRHNTYRAHMHMQEGRKEAKKSRKAKRGQRPAKTRGKHGKGQNGMAKCKKCQKQRKEG